RAGRVVTDDADAPLDLATGGLLCAFFRVGGRTFEREDKMERSFHGAQQHLKSLAALTHYDRHKEEAEREWPWEAWRGRYEWRDAHPEPACLHTRACAALDGWRPRTQVSADTPGSARRGF